MTPEDKLICAMSAKQPLVQLKNYVGSIDGLFKRTFKKDRRLLAFLSSYSAASLKTSRLQLSADYDVTIVYQETCPASLDDVEVDDGAWDERSVLAKGFPREVTLVTSDEQSVSKKMEGLVQLLLSNYEGICGWKMDAFRFEPLTTDVVCRIGYSYLIPLQDLRAKQGRSAFEARNIWKTILGRAKVPTFVKPFLAHSFLTQECVYDQRAYDELEGDPSRQPSDSIPHLAYGPLIERRGICSGLAWAFKTLMDTAKIECICVSGFLKEAPKVAHMWNMVKLDGMYYHVDPTWGIKDSGVFIGELMQPDAMMRSTHIWNEADYPSARGTRFDYDFVEEFLSQHGNDYLDDGARDTYFFPEEIVD